MTIIDQTTFTVSCSCGETESKTIHQHGSKFGGTWEPAGEMVKFTVYWNSDDELTVPEITSAQCKTCGADDCHIAIH